MNHGFTTKELNKNVFKLYSNHGFATLTID